VIDRHAWNFVLMPDQRSEVMFLGANKQRTTDRHV